jgi:hypothetical protein
MQWTQDIGLTLATVLAAVIKPIDCAADPNEGTLNSTASGKRYDD